MSFGPCISTFYQLPDETESIGGGTVCPADTYPCADEDTPAASDNEESLTSSSPSYWDTTADFGHSFNFEASSPTDSNASDHANHNVHEAAGDDCSDNASVDTDDTVTGDAANDTADASGHASFATIAPDVITTTCLFSTPKGTPCGKLLNFQLCDAEIYVWAHLQHDHASVSPTPRKKWKCRWDNCPSKRMGTLLGVKRHIVEHHLGLKAVRCPRCNKTLSRGNDYSYRRHPCVAAEAVDMNGSALQSTSFDSTLLNAPGSSSTGRRPRKKARRT